MKSLQTNLSNISDIKVGTYVLSYDHILKKQVVNRVLTVWENFAEDNNQMKIVTTEDTILCTKNHKIWTKNRGWKSAINLTLNDILLSSSNNDISITEINCEYERISEIFYDLEVDDSRCYYVGENDPFLVHNSVTVFVPVWNYEIESIIVLKNNRGTDDTRVRHMDYCIQLSELFYKRFMNNENITLFSNDDTPGLYESFGSDKFDELYLHYETSDVRKKVIPMQKLFLDLVEERSSTARIYIMNIDHANTHSGYGEQVYMSNLCIEVIQPARPLQFIDDTGIHKYRVLAPISNFSKLYDLTYNNKFLEHYQIENIGKIVGDDYVINDGSEFVVDVKIIDKEPPNISSCILGAISWEGFSDDMGKNYTIMKRLCTLEIESLNAIIDLQKYSIPSTEIATKCGRYLGVGIAGYATFAAKMGYDYNNPKLWEITHRLAEMQMYCLLLASNELAKQVGECQWFYKTKYALGILPIDTYKKTVDDIVPNTLYMDWEGLRKSIKEHGLRNSAFAACMPVQSSSVISNSTNGLELPRTPLTIIKSKNRYLRQIIKDFSQLEDTYTYAYDQDWNVGYINNCAVIQKFFDQSISANTYYSPVWYNGNVPITILVQHILYAYKMGLKTLYYQNTDDCRDEFENDTPACTIDDKDCESCKL
jgi:ribonucleoside-diphosphate reductase alpha chain